MAKAGSSNSNCLDRLRACPETRLEIINCSQASQTASSGRSLSRTPSLAILISMGAQVARRRKTLKLTQAELSTTSEYLPKDSLALTLNGSIGWPTAKELRKLGETRGGGAPSKIRRILERIPAAIQDTTKEVDSYTE